MMRSGETFGKIHRNTSKVSLPASANEAIGQALEIQIIPDPSTERLTIKWKEEYPSANFSLLNANGQVLIPSLNIRNGSRLTFDVPEGIYRVLLEIGDQRYVEFIPVY